MDDAMDKCLEFLAIDEAIDACLVLLAIDEGTDNTWTHAFSVPLMQASANDPYYLPAMEPSTNAS